MQPRQVFRSYVNREDSNQEGFKYCPSCGANLLLGGKHGRPRPTCESCGYVHYRNPHPGVVVLLESEDRVLLGKRIAGGFREAKWCLPGGFVEYDEDFLTAAIREVREEVGVEIQIKSILSVVSNFFAPRLHTLVIVLLAQIVRGDPVAGDDIETVDWFPLSGPLPEMAFCADRHIIERYYKTRIEGAPVDPEYAIMAYGFGGRGTLASSVYFKTVIEPDLSSYTRDYYIVQWDDTNGNGHPDSPGADTYTPITPSP